MGLMKSVMGTEAKDEKPYWAPTGIYPAKLVRISLSDSTLGKFKVYTLHWNFRPLNAPTPLDYPVVKQDLDANIPGERAVLYAIVGQPQISKGSGKVSWDPTGLIVWNGGTEDAGQFAGELDLHVESREPRPKQGNQGGWWPPNYKVTDFDPPGTASDLAAADAAALAEAAGKDADPSDAADTALAMAEGKGKGKGKGGK